MNARSICMLKMPQPIMCSVPEEGHPLDERGLPGRELVAGLGVHIVHPSLACGRVRRLKEHLSEGTPVDVLDAEIVPSFDTGIRGMEFESAVLYRARRRLDEPDVAALPSRQEPARYRPLVVVPAVGSAFDRRRSGL